MTPSDLGERLRDIQALMRASGGWTDEAKGPINEAADMLLAQEQRIAVLEAADYSFMEEVGWQARAIDAESRILDLRELLAMDDADFLTINGLTKRLKAADAELTRLRAVEKAAVDERLAQCICIQREFERHIHDPECPVILTWKATTALLVREKGVGE